MSAYKNYKNLVSGNIFGVAERIKTQRKSNKKNGKLARRTSQRVRR